jgi:hypothetical protein
MTADKAPWYPAHLDADLHHPSALCDRSTHPTTSHSMSSSTRPKPSRKTSASHRNTLSLSRTEVTIHVYDLLPPGKVSTVLWAIGSSLLHTGVVIGDREYAYGGHDLRNQTGVYWTKPGLEPPGGTFRQAILHGFSFRPPEELDAIIHQVNSRLYSAALPIANRLRPPSSFRARPTTSSPKTATTSPRTSVKSSRAAPLRAGSIAPLA